MKIFHLTQGGGGGGSLTLDSIAVTTPPDKIDYLPGETFDPTGMVVTGYYNGGTLSRPVTGYTISPAGPLEEGTTAVTITYAEGGAVKTTVQPIEVGTPIYGASWDGSSSPAWTRTDAAALFANPVPYASGMTAEQCSSPFDAIMPWAGMVKSERTGGTMVAIPKFYYKLTQNGDGLNVQISEGPRDGFCVSPAHMDRGDGAGERDIVYVGRYKCGSNYKSVTGDHPYSIDKASFRTSIHSLGDNIWQSDYLMRFTIWLLYIVEFAHWNSQEKVGHKSSADSGKYTVGYTDSMPYHTGSVNRGAQYRNVEGLWDNVMEFTDGCYYNSHARICITVNPSNFADLSGGKEIGPNTSGAGSIIKKYTVTEFDGIQLMYPSELGGSGTTYTCDGMYSTSNVTIAQGGFYNYQELNGFLYTSYWSSGSYDNMAGSRLQELP